MLDLDGRNKTILLISDQHAPYMHSDMLAFLTALKERYLDDDSIIINMGDEVDYHAISFHSSDVDLYSAGHELDLAIEKLSHLNKLFPKMYLLESNHGSLVYRRAKADGIPIRSLKPLSELYNTPDWSWHHDIVLETNHRYKTYLCHGKKSTYNGLSSAMGMNAIQGHYHGKSEITWSRTATMWRYNMFTGCLINHESLAYAYGRNHLPKPILSLGIIDKDGMPHLKFMDLDKDNRWTGKIT